MSLRTHQPSEIKLMHSRDSSRACLKHGITRMAANATLPALANPYLDEFLAHVGPQYDWRSNRYEFSYGREWEIGFSLIDHDLRRNLIAKYSYAIPTEEAVQAIAELG